MGHDMNEIGAVLLRHAFRYRPRGIGIALLLMGSCTRIEAAPPADLLDAKDLPEHGSIMIEPVSAVRGGEPDWQWAMISGNGTMGALVNGVPGEDAIVLAHEKFYLDWVRPLKQPDMRPYVAQARTMLAEEFAWRAGSSSGKRQPRPKVTAGDFLYEKGKELGYERQQDPSFHPGFKLLLHTPGQSATQADAVRFENFATGEAVVRWRDAGTTFERRLFVSRPAGAAVLCIKADRPGKVTLTMQLDPKFLPPKNKDKQEVLAARFGGDVGELTLRAKYLMNEGGYAGLARIIPRGGKMEFDGADNVIRITGADEVVALLGLQPSAPWAPCPQVGDVNDLDAALASLRRQLAGLPADYEALLRPHVAVHGALFNRVCLDLGGGAGRKSDTAALLRRADSEKRLSPALLEKMYEAGRYVIISTCGEWPPCLQGKFAGSWVGGWGASFTLDTNLQCAIGGALSANLPECLKSLFNMCEFYLPDWRENATLLWGCRGIQAAVRGNSTGKNFLWGTHACQFMTCNAPWLGHFYHDYYLYTGDKEFLRNRCVPYLKECVLFYEDFKTTDPDGTWRFRPSYSPEIGLTDNSTIDIAACREMLLALAAACEELGTEPENVERWRAEAARLPKYVTGENGLSEYAVPGAKFETGHRHFSLLHPIMYTHELDPQQTPELWAAARRVWDRRMAFVKDGDSKGDGAVCSFSRMYAGMCANRFGEGDTTLELLRCQAANRALFPSLVASHNGNHRTFNVDANGSIPELVNGMLVFSLPGRLDLLPALPEALPKGEIGGILARGQITVERLAWDMSVHTLRVALVSGRDQRLNVCLPKAQKLKFIRVEGTPQPEPAGSDNTIVVMLAKDRKVVLEIGF